MGRDSRRNTGRGGSRGSKERGGRMPLKPDNRGRGRGRGKNGKPAPDWVKASDPMGKTFTCFPFKDDHRGRLKYNKVAGYRGVFNADKLKGKNAKALSTHGTRMRCSGVSR